MVFSEIGADGRELRSEHIMRGMIDSHRRIEDPAPDEVVAWIRASAIPLDHCDAGHDFADMQPLRSIVGNARIVSLGEATHGTREFFQLKHRMVEFLVKEMGFTAFAIEANLPEAFMLDQYVTTGKGDPVHGLANLCFFTCNNEETLALVKWIREHNVTAARPVRFYGFDMQSPLVAFREIVRALRKIDPHLAADLEPRLRPLNVYLASEYAALPREKREEVEKALAQATARLAASRFANEREKAIVELHCRVAAQAARNACMQDEEWPYRDQAMAENVQSLLDLEGPDGKIVVWAHNGHVGRLGCDQGGWMGHHLHKVCKEGYVAFGFAFANGSFQAWDIDGGGLRDFTAPPPPQGSLDETLHRAGIPVFALDLRRIPPEGKAGTWLRTPHVTRGAGAQFSDDVRKAMETYEFEFEMTAHELYDAILFVDATTPAKANAVYRRSAFGPKILPSPGNLDFSAVAPDGTPDGWHLASQFNYTIEARDRVATLSRLNNPLEWGEGILIQSFDARPYHGKQLHVHAELLVESLGEWDSVYFSIAAIDDNRKTDDERFSLAENIVSADSKHPGVWHDRSATLAIPDAATHITISLGLVGNGCVRMRSVRIEGESVPVMKL